MQVHQMLSESESLFIFGEEPRQGESDLEIGYQGPRQVLVTSSILLNA